MNERYWALRRGRTPVQTLTVCRRHARYGVAADVRGRGVHRVKWVVIDWSQPSPEVLAAWMCGGVAERGARLMLEPNGEMCGRCRHWDKADAFPVAHRGVPCVYYGRSEDGLIKIGVTRHLGARLAALQVEPLAVEAGGFALERERHLQFDAERLTGEWFQPSGRLLSHVAAVRSLFALEAVA